MNAAIFKFRLSFLFLWAGAVYAAEQMKVDPTMIPARMWVLVFGAILAGYLASSAEMLFGWVETKGWREFGKLVQSFFCSLVAGVMAYLIGLYAELSPIGSILAVMPAAFAGEAYVRKMAERRIDIDKGKP